MPKISIFGFSKALVKTQISFPCFEKSDEQRILQGCELDSDLTMIWFIKIRTSFISNKQARILMPFVAFQVSIVWAFCTKIQCLLECNGILWRHFRYALRMFGELELVLYISFYWYVCMFHLNIFFPCLWTKQGPLNNRSLRERGMASNPKMKYQVFLCIFPNQILVMDGRTDKLTNDKSLEKVTIGPKISWSRI